MLERIQAHRLAYIAAKHNLFPSTQYRGITSCSVQDTILAVTHDIEVAWNHDCMTSMLTFNITGFFDTIPHLHLLHTL